MNDAVKLLRVLAMAERLRLRLQLRRHAMRGILLLGGLVFLTAAVAMLHVLGFMALMPRLTPVEAASVVLAVDLGCCLALVVAAVRLGPGKAERDALALRQRARAELTRQAQVVRLGMALLAFLRRKGR